MVKTVINEEVNLDIETKTSVPEIEIEVTSSSADLVLDANKNDYNELYNKPRINGVTLIGDKTGAQLALTDLSVFRVEVAERIAEDIHLQEQIDAINLRADIVDIVASKAELDVYPTTHLTKNDVILVAKDETRKGYLTSYRWVDGAWVFVTETVVSYTKEEIDALILAEATARQEADAVLQTNINNEATIRQSEDNKEKNARIAADTAEATAREEADAVLQSNIDAEALARQTADTTLQNNIDAEKADRIAADTAEATARASADTTLQSNIDAEASTRATADATLQSNIDAEETARIAADAVLQTNINVEAETRRIADVEITNKINTEITNRQNADAVLQSNIDAEATARASADTTLQTNINTEITNRQAADTTLQSNIDTEKQERISAIEAEATARATADTAEATLRTNADMALQSNINAEESARITADTTLQSNLDTEASVRATADTTLQNNIDSEITARQAADTTLQTNITAEATARTNADTTLQSNIDAEESERKEADETLQDNIDAEATARATADTTLQTNITTEATARASADTTLQSNIDAEATARANADTTLQTNITAEATARQAADTTLQNNIDTKVTKNEAITAGTHTKITYDSKGLVTAGAELTEADIPSLHLEKISDVTATATEVNYLDGVTSNVQTQIDSKVNTADIVDNTYTATATVPLSANMGKELQDQINNLKSIGRFLSLWDCSTGLPTTNPTVLPYTYHTGDYFIISKIATGDGLNYRPNGATYEGTASTTVETSEVSPNDIYFYDSTVWKLLANTQKTVTFASIAGSWEDNASLVSGFATKVTKNETIEAGTHTKITYDSKGLVTGGTDLVESDIPSLHLNKISDVTVTATEVNYLDGVTSNVQTQIDSKQAILTTDNAGDNVTITETSGIKKINALPGLTASVTELNYVDGVTSPIQTQIDSKQAILTNTNAGDNVTVTEVDGVKKINALSGLTATVTELNYSDGVTSNIQTQLDSKQAVLSSANAGDNVTITEVDGVKKINTLTGLTASVTELNYVDGVTSAIQTQLDSKAVYPTQTGKSGKFLQTDGSNVSWETVDALPSQTGKSGRYLKTDGTTATWETVDALPSQTGKNGRYLKTNGTNASWEELTVGDGTLTIKANGTTVGTFSANQSTNSEVNITIPDSATWGNISGNINNQTDLMNELNAKTAVIWRTF